MFILSVTKAQNINPITYFKMNYKHNSNLFITLFQGSSIVSNGKITGSCRIIFLQVKVHVDVSYNGCSQIRVTVTLLVAMLVCFIVRL